MKSISKTLVLLYSLFLATSASAETYWLNVIGLYEKGENTSMSIATSNQDSCHQALGFYVRNEHVAAISCDIRPLGK